MSLGTRIKSWREQAKLQQGDLATKAGISRSFLSAIENDKRDPAISVVLSLCKVLECGPGELLDKLESDATGTGLPELPQVPNLEREDYHRRREVRAASRSSRLKLIAKFAAKR